MLWCHGQALFLRANLYCQEDPQDLNKEHLEQFLLEISPHEDLF